MKFAIVLLGLFALTSARHESRNIITDKINSLVSDFTSKAFGDLDKIVGETLGLASLALGREQGIVSDAKGQLNYVTGKFENDLNEAILTGGQTKTCALNQVNQLANIKADSITKVDGCATSLTNGIASFQAEVLGHVSSLRGSLSDMGGLAKQCISVILDAIKCAISKINAGKVAYDNVTENISQATELFKIQTATGLQYVQSCAASTVDSATQQVNQLSDNLQRCL